MGKLLQINQYLQLDTSTTCCVCTIPIAIPERTLTSFLKNNHTFYCVFGHPQHFVPNLKVDTPKYNNKISEQEATIDKLKLRIAKLERLVPWWRKRKIP